MRSVPAGVSVREFTCPGCGEAINVPVLTESSRRPAEIRAFVNAAPLIEHVKKRHPEVAA